MLCFICCTFDAVGGFVIVCVCYNIIVICRKPKLFDAFSTLKQSAIDKENRRILNIATKSRYNVDQKAGLFFANDYTEMPNTIIFSNLSRYHRVQIGDEVENQSSSFSSNIKTWYDAKRNLITFGDLGK